MEHAEGRTEFIDMPASQTGENIRDAVFDSLKDFGIAHRLFGYTGDGGSNIKSAFKELRPKLTAERTLRGKGNDGKTQGWQKL